MKFICSKISLKLYLMYKLRARVPFDTLKMLYNAGILPNFYHCDVIIWNTVHTKGLQHYKKERRVLS